jgi:transposase
VEVLGQARDSGAYPECVDECKQNKVIRMRTKLPGKPSKYSSAVTKRIFRTVSQGLSREAAAALAGINLAALYEWQSRFPEFSEELKKADARFEQASVRRMAKAGGRPRYWTAIAWMLERKFPQHYGKIDRHVIRTQHEGVALPPEYVKAINRAVGVEGEFKPLIKGELPQPRDAGGDDGSGDAIDPELFP